MRVEILGFEPSSGHRSLAGMTDALPSVTIIVPARPGQAEILAAAAVPRLDYPPEKMEIIVARGRQPSRQRNAALKEARGELIYFLDDDAIPDRGNLRRGCGHFARPEVQMVGGPNLCPLDAPRLERVFAVVLASWLAFGPSRARYEAVGAVRETSEKELILCNLLARREALLELGGFDEALYPNEENALMDHLQKQGAKLIYDPDLVVRRRPRPSMGAFARMLLTYGRGRAEQWRRHPTMGSLLNFVPPLFVLYLLVALLVAPWVGLIALAPLALYGAAILLQAGASSFRHGLGRSLAAAPWVVITHLLYGLGFWRGLRTPLRNQSARPGAEVTLERIHSLPCAK